MPRQVQRGQGKDAFAGYSVRTARYRYTEWFENYKSYDPYDEKKIIGREFYDYEKDPQEKVSEASNPAYQKEVADLAQKLKAHLTQQFQVSQKSNGVAAYYQKNQKQ